MEDRTALFEQTMLPHLDAAYNLARWLAGNEHDAEDIVQESCLRALKFIGGFRGGNPRAWLLTIVRHTAYTWLQRRRTDLSSADWADDAFEFEDPASNPEALLEAATNVERVRAAIAQLPTGFREVIVLREMEEYSYKEIADAIGLPLGTVMSRLARARKQLLRLLSTETPTAGGHP